jgi:hypothetical protein
MPEDGDAHFKHGADESDALANVGRYIIDIYHIPTDKNVTFKAWINSFSDSYQSNWETTDVYGRMDPISTFQNTKRTISMEWDVVAGSENEAKDNMKKCELLFAMLYPTYEATAGGDSASSLQQGPLFKIKFGNLITVPGANGPAAAKGAGLLGTLDGFEYSPDFEAGFFTPGVGEMYPQLITLSAEFQVLHNFPVGWEKTADGYDFRDKSGFPYGKIVVEDEKVSDSANDTLTGPQT